MTAAKTRPINQTPTDVMNVDEAAAYMRISRRTLYRLVALHGATGLTIIPVSAGRRVLRRSDIDRYLAKRASA